MERAANAKIAKEMKTTRIVANETGRGAGVETSLMVGEAFDDARIADRNQLGR